MNQMKSKTIYSAKWTIPALFFYSVFIVVPFLMSLTLSLTDWNIDRFYTPNFRGIGNYITIFQDPIFLRSLGNTLLFAFCTTILKTLFGLLLALGLLKTSRVNSILRTIFYIPCVLSPLIIGVVFTSILANDGLLNNMLDLIGMSGVTRDWLASYGSAMCSVILIEGWMWSGFNMFIFISGLQAIPKEFYEAASTEGVTKWKQFWYITMPLLVPSFTVIITLNITGSLKVFDLIYVLTNGGPGFDTQVLSTFTYRAFGLGLLGESSASAVVLMLIVSTISFSFNRILRRKEIEM
ncbi:MAG: carbohydrate ABC transporter permease [Lachnospiraceae bacterium]